MKIIIGADHGGFQLKEEIKLHLQKNNLIVEDIGNLVYDAKDDYPDYAIAVANNISTGKGEKGIVVCGSGVGASIAANKIKGVRAAVCHDLYSAAQGVEHDDMNVLCLGGRIIETNFALKLVDAFVAAKFSGEERHVRRLQKVLELEASE